LVPGKKTRGVEESIPFARCGDKMAAGLRTRSEAERTEGGETVLDCGLLSPDLAAGIRRVKGVKKIGVRLGIG
jgi:hypothetical protein